MGCVLTTEATNLGQGKHIGIPFEPLRIQKGRLALRIVRVTEYMVPPGHPLFGGMSACEYFLCRGLAKLGHEVSLITSDIPPGSNLLPKAVRFPSNSYDGFQTKRTFAVVNLGGDMPIMPFLPIQMGSLDADIVHFHEYYNFSSIVAWAISRAKRIPFTYTQDRYYFVKRRVWQPFFQSLNKTLLRRIRNSPRLVTAFSTAAAEFLRQQGYSRERISVIPLGVDTRKFTPNGDAWFRELLGFDRNLLVLMTVARLHRSKNLESLIRATALLPDHTKNLRLVIIGRGPHEEPLRSLIRRLGLDKQVVIFTAPIPSNRMPGVYNSCDVFVLPSLYEPFGMAVLEATACAKPVVVTDVGGMRDTVVDGENGFRVPLSNNEALPRALATRITHLLNNAEIARRMGKAGRKRAELLYNWETIARLYDEFYKLLVS